MLYDLYGCVAAHIRRGAAAALLIAKVHISACRLDCTVVREKVFQSRLRSQLSITKRASTKEKSRKRENEKRKIAKKTSRRAAAFNVGPKASKCATFGLLAIVWFWQIYQITGTGKHMDMQGV